MRDTIDDLRETILFLKDKKHQSKFPGIYVAVLKDLRAQLRAMYKEEMKRQEARFAEADRQRTLPTAPVDNSLDAPDE